MDLAGAGEFAPDPARIGRGIVRAEDDPVAEIGDRIGPFEIIELIEQGALSTLYRGLRADGTSRQPREVILRQAAAGPDGMPLPEALDAVRAEYETLRVLQDDRIPQAVALYGGHGASARMCVHGASLRDTLRLVDAGRVDLDAATSADILVELAYALRHTHAIVREEGGRIVHGTLAPDVVWLTAEGKVMLLGIGDPEPSHPRPLAPEQQHGVQDPRTDQWLLGALGIDLLRHAPEVLAQARGASVEVAYGLLQARWPEATRVLARLLAESPANRYDGDERLIKELLALARHLGGVSKRAEAGARTMQLVASLGGADAASLLVMPDPEPVPAAVPVPAYVPLPRVEPVRAPVAPPRAEAMAVPVAPPRAEPKLRLDDALRGPPLVHDADPTEVYAPPRPFGVPSPLARPSLARPPAVKARPEPVIVEDTLTDHPVWGGLPAQDTLTEDLFADDPLVEDLLAADPAADDALEMDIAVDDEAPAAPAVAAALDDLFRDEPRVGSDLGSDLDSDLGPDAGSDLEADPASDPGAEPSPRAFRPTSVPLEDPVPDRVVFGAMIAFGVVTALVLAWRFTSS